MILFTSVTSRVQDIMDTLYILEVTTDTPSLTQFK